MKIITLVLFLCACCGNDDVAGIATDGSVDGGTDNSDGQSTPTNAIPGGTFLRSFDGVTSLGMNNSYPATVNSFALDKYEVTVARFRVFVASTSLPTAPLNCGVASFPSMWSDAAGANEAKPINCITWTEASAFCAWDGGRLPTEAEWNYAAAGGGEQRVYPWSSPPTDQTLDATHASYDKITPVGSKPTGDGRWGQSDLAGNVAEWVADWYADPYTNPCVDCVNTTPATARAHRGGGVVNLSPTAWISVVRRAAAPADTRSPAIGVRCARAQ